MPWWGGQRGRGLRKLVTLYPDKKQMLVTLYPDKKRDECMLLLNSFLCIEVSAGE